MPRKMTLADIVAALGELNTNDFPNAAAMRAACELVQAVKDAPELERLAEKYKRIVAEMKSGGNAKDE